MLNLPFEIHKFLRHKSTKKRLFLIWEAAKNVLLLLAGPLRPNPPPSSLMAFGTSERWKKKVKKKFFFPFFLNGPALYPPPPLNGLDIKKFFCGFPMADHFFVKLFHLISIS